MGSDEDAERRLEALETALAHAEAAVEDLSETCRAHWREIDALKAEIGKLTRTLAAALASEEDEPPADRPPPHY